MSARLDAAVTIADGLFSSSWGPRPHAFNLQPFAMNLGDAQVFDVATWDARLAHYPMAARHAVRGAARRDRWR